jgi:hypothetical protein
VNWLPAAGTVTAATSSVMTKMVGATATRITNRA